MNQRKTILAVAVLASASPAEAQIPFEDVTGIYDLAPDRSLVVAPLSIDGPPELAFVDTGTGRIRLLRREGSDRWTAGPTILAEAPVAHRLTFERGPGGRVEAVTWHDEEGGPRRAVRHPLEVEEVLLRGPGGSRLAGSLIAPSGPDTRPAAVLVHGSGDRDRWSFGPMPWILARHGIATLVWDKRRSESEDPALGTLAADLELAVERIAARPDVDPDRIAIVGVSEGAWVGSLAAGAAPERIAALALISGTPLPVWRADLHARRVALRAAGIAGEDLEAAMRLERRAIDYVRTGRGYTAYVSARSEIADEPWFGLTRGNVPIASISSRWAEALRYDPGPDLARYAGPILLVVGELDAFVPPAPSVERMREIADESGNDDVTARLLEDGLHHLLEAPSDDPVWLEGVTRYVPGYWDLLVGWLMRRLDGQPVNDETRTSRDDSDRRTR